MNVSRKENKLRRRLKRISKKLTRNKRFKTNLVNNKTNLVNNKTDCVNDFDRVSFRPLNNVISESVKDFVLNNVNQDTFDRNAWRPS